MESYGRRTSMPTVARAALPQSRVSNQSSFPIGRCTPLRWCRALTPANAPAGTDVSPC